MGSGGMRRWVLGGSGSGGGNVVLMTGSVNNDPECDWVGCCCERCGLNDWNC